MKEENTIRLLRVRLARAVLTLKKLEELRKGPEGKELRGGLKIFLDNAFDYIQALSWVLDELPYPDCNYVSRFAEMAEKIKANPSFYKEKMDAMLKLFFSQRDKAESSEALRMWQGVARDTNRLLSIDWDGLEE